MMRSTSWTLILFAALTSRGKLSGQSSAQLVSEPRAEVNQSLFGAHIQRTISLLERSTSERRWPVHILIYGQSIVASADFTNDLQQALQQKYPNADIHLENRAIGGFTGDRLVRTSMHDLYPAYPDLVIFHVYEGQESGDTERIFHNLQRWTTAEVIILNDHRQLKAPVSEKSIRFWDYIASKYNFELVDLSHEWQAYLDENHMAPQQLLRDAVHPNSTGYLLMTNLVMRHFNHNSSVPSGWAPFVRTMEAKRALEENIQDEITLKGDSWHTTARGIVGDKKGDSLHLSFVGNRLDVQWQESVPEKCGTAKVLIDGKAPSSLDGAYTFTLPSKGPGTWFPALTRVSSEAPLRAEEWTATITRINADASDFDFSVNGSVTGADGSGNSRRRFVSMSHRVMIEPRDWMFASIMQIFKQKDPPPVGYEVHWKAIPASLDIFEPTPASSPALVQQLTLVKAISNGRHTLDLILNGDGPVILEAIQVHEPQLH